MVLETNVLPAEIDTRGKTPLELSARWAGLAGYGRKEILERWACLKDDVLEKARHVDLEDLSGLLNTEELQRVVDILARYGKTWGLHYAYDYNTCVKSASVMIFKLNLDGRSCSVFADGTHIGMILNGKFYTDPLILNGVDGLWTLELFPDDLELIRQEIAKYPHVTGILSVI